MDPIATLLSIDPAILISWLITVVVGAIAVGQYRILKDVLELSQDLAVFWVAKARITADGKITTEEAEEAVNYGFKFLTKLESIVGTYILNRPETGWIKAYAPGAVEQLAQSARKE